MTAYTLDASCAAASGGDAMPQPPAELPPDASNI
jgi:4,5-DOPA dioxygenase extradiol